MARAEIGQINLWQGQRYGKSICGRGRDMASGSLCGEQGASESAEARMGFGAEAGARVEEWGVMRGGVKVSVAGGWWAWTVDG